MEHPLITDADSLNIDDLQSRINDLTKKLGVAHRMGNAYLANQIRMALETYKNKYQEKIAETYRKDDGKNFDDKINIS